jgi:hypothetical protein
MAFPIDIENGLEWSVLNYSQILLEHLERDFDGFCKRFDAEIVSHGERFRDGIIFNIHLSNEYYLIVFSEDRKLKGFQLVNSFINAEINQKDKSVLFKL